MLLGVADGLADQQAGDPVMLHLGPHGQVNEMQAVFLVKLVRPAGIEIISSHEEVPESFQADILADKVFVRLQLGPQLRQIKLKWVVGLRLIGNHQDPV